MKNVLIRLLRTGESDRDRNHMSSWRKAALILVFGAALAGQLWRFGDPYMLAYETGFQEMIARHHLQPGLSETHGISTITFLDPDPNYNPTHPPLLQLILAFLYWVFGDSEQTSRIVPLASFILSFWGLWRLTHGKISADGRLAVVMAYAFAPLFFFSGRVVNFEPPVVACVIWTAVLVEELNHSFRWSWFIGLGLLAVAGTLLDWPYPLFVGCLFVFAWFRRDVSKAYYRPVYLVWGLALTAKYRICDRSLFHRILGYFSASRHSPIGNLSAQRRVPAASNTFRLEMVDVTGGTCFSLWLSCARVDNPGVVWMGCIR